MNPKTQTQYRWWWMIPLLLVFAAVAVPGLDADALWYDEIRSYLHAGGAHLGPKTLPQVWASLQINAPDQAPGYPLLLNLWGGALGWSEFGVRALSLLMGLLCLSLLYRAGQAMLGAWGGYGAAIVLGTSAYFVQFTHEARAFILGMASLALVLWCYWHLTYVRPTRVHALGLAIGALGMLYAHYFIALLLPVLALYHVLLAPKNRRWWAPLALAVPVALAFTPALLMLGDGIARNEANARLDALAMTPPQVGWAALRFFGNGLPLLAAFVFAVGMFAAWRGQRRAATRFILFIAVVGTLAVIAVNQWMGLIIPGRERYLAGLWVPLGLLAGVGVATLAHWRRVAAAGLLGVWAIVGLWATWDGNMVFAGESRELAWRDLRTTVDTHVSPADVLAFHAPKFPWGTRVPFDFYTEGLPIRAELIESLESEDVMQAYADGATRVWLGTDHRYPPEPQLGAFERAVMASHTVCETWALDDLTSITLYAQMSAYCPTSTPIAVFGGGVTLVGATEPTVNADGLSVHTHWHASQNVPANTYSVGLHLLAEGQLVAQHDMGLPPQPTLLLETHLPTSELPAGKYHLTAIAYNWQTGDRLPLSVPNADDPTRLVLATVQLP